MAMREKKCKYELTLDVPADTNMSWIHQKTWFVLQEALLPVRISGLFLIEEGELEETIR